MNRMRPALTLVLSCQLAGLLAAPPPARAQAGVAESQQHIRDAAAARERCDDDRVIRSLESARELNPAGLYTRYNLARAYARNGQVERALDLLEGLARARVDFGIADDPALAVLAGEPRFRRLLETLGRRTASVRNSRKHTEIARIDLLPEGIARDAATDRLFFGSMRSGEVFVIDSAGRVSKFAEVGYDGRLAAIGMTVDAHRGLLWVVGTAFFLTDGYDPQKPAWSGLFGFDLDSGEQRQRYLRRDDAATHFLRAPADLTLYGIDGLYLHDGDLVAVQNGVEPWRLMRFELDEDMTAVTAAQVLELGQPAVATTAAIAGDAIHYVAVLPTDAEAPSHIDPLLHEYLGRTVIRTVPLD